MTRTVDVVVIGIDPAATAASIEAIRRGLRVLIVIRRRGTRVAHQHRQSLRAACTWSARQVTIVSGALVACVDGVNGIEAVVVRHVATGRLTGFNASALLDFGERGSSPDSRAPIRDRPATRAGAPAANS